MHTYAQNVAATVTPPQSVNNSLHGVDRWAHRPHYARDFIWGDSEQPRVTLAMWTESAQPLPSPPANELTNAVAIKTIEENPHLFKIVTPINVDRLELLLASHPNRSFVFSLCHGFRHGFWPWAVTEGVERPLIVDNSFRPLTEESHIHFVREQRDVEISLG